MMWDSYKGQGAHPDLKPRLLAVFPEHVVPAVSVRQHLSRKGGGDGSWAQRQPGHAAGRLQMSVFCVDRESGGFVTKS